MMVGGTGNRIPWVKPLMHRITSTPVTESRSRKYPTEFSVNRKIPSISMGLRPHRSMRGDRASRVTSPTMVSPAPISPTSVVLPPRRSTCTGRM